MLKFSNAGYHCKIILWFFRKSVSLQHELKYVMGALIVLTIVTVFGISLLTYFHYTDRKADDAAVIG